MVVGNLSLFLTKILALLQIGLLQDALIVKAPKKSPLALRMVVLSVVMICGVYICSICLKQIGTQPNPRLMRAELVDIPCRDPRIPESELPYVHYPEPISYSRY